MQTLTSAQALKQSNDEVKYISVLCRKHPNNPVFKNRLQHAKAVKKVTIALIKKGYRIAAK